MSGHSAQDDHRTRSNSYHFVPVSDVLRASGAPCPLVHEPGESAGLPLERALYVRFRDRMRRFETNTRDFNSAELRAVKDVNGQIYADISRKRAVDDFSKDLRMLRRSRECSVCTRRAACPGCWVPVRENVFETSEAALLTLLEGVEGSVLDVGCGEGRYLRAFETRAHEGRIDYLGIDPDASALNVLGSANPWAHFRVGTVESLLEADADANADADADTNELSPGSFDHILVLRSFNHLPKPEDTATRLVELLREGGKLIVADNVAFGLVRSHEQASSGESSEALFEHYRNASAAFAHAIFSRHGLELFARQDVGPTTSNQWHLAYITTPKVHMA